MKVFCVLPCTRSFNRPPCWRTSRHYWRIFPQAIEHDRHLHWMLRSFVLSFLLLSRAALMPPKRCRPPEQGIRPSQPRPHAREAERLERLFNMQEQRAAEQESNAADAAAQEALRIEMRVQSNALAARRRAEMKKKREKTLEVDRRRKTRNANALEAARKRRHGTEAQTLSANATSAGNDTGTGTSTNLRYVCHHAVPELFPLTSPFVVLVVFLL